MQASSNGSELCQNKMRLPNLLTIAEHFLEGADHLLKDALDSPGFHAVRISRIIIRVNFSDKCAGGTVVLLLIGIALVAFFTGKATDSAGVDGSAQLPINDKLRVEQTV